MTYGSIEEVEGRYSVIYADPPWNYRDNKSNLPKMGGVTYRQMTDEDLQKMDVQRICEKDCALFMWVTMPKLPEGIDLIKAWGFTYTTCAFVWVKQNPKNDGIYSGLGHWVNGNAEICLLAKKGSPKRQSKNVKQIVLSHRREHSRKPDEVRDRIVKLMGDVPRIELFARQAAEGWDSMGNEIKEKVL